MSTNSTRAARNRAAQELAAFAGDVQAFDVAAPGFGAPVAPRGARADRWPTIEDDQARLNSTTALTEAAWAASHQLALIYERQALGINRALANAAEYAADQATRKAGFGARPPRGSKARGLWEKAFDGRWRELATSDLGVKEKAYRKAVQSLRSPSVAVYPVPAGKNTYKVFFHKRHGSPLPEQGRPGRRSPTFGASGGRR